MSTSSLPEDVLDRARQYRGSGDERAWEMADWISGVVNGNTRTRGDRTRALKQLAQAMGVSRATTSDLCQLAETYEPGVREQFSSALDKINAQWDFDQLKLSQPITATIDTTGVSRFDISILDIHPGDVIVIKMTQQMPRVEIDSLKRNVSMALPDHEIIVLLDGIELSVMRQKE